MHRTGAQAADRFMSPGQAGWSSCYSVTGNARLSLFAGLLERRHIWQRFLIRTHRSFLSPKRCADQPFHRLTGQEPTNQPRWNLSRRRAVDSPENVALRGPWTAIRRDGDWLGLRRSRNIRHCLELVRGKSRGQPMPRFDAGSTCLPSRAFDVWKQGGTDPDAHTLSRVPEAARGFTHQAGQSDIVTPGMIV